MSTELTPEKMMGFLYELPDQFDRSLRLEIDVAQYNRNYHNIIVTGLGGSAIGGDILRSYALQKANIPVLVNRDYDLPEYTGPDTLVFAVSYSGNTEETLSAYQQARSKGADIICLTAGGKLMEMGQDDGYTIIKVPGGLVPRAATGYLFAPLALALEKMGLLQGVTADLEEVVLVLQGLREALSPRVDAPDNKAKVIAARMKDSIPVIWGVSGTSEIAALRWKAQINENAKSPAYYNVFPELNHNEIVGFEVPPELLSRLAIIILRCQSDKERINKRIEISKNIIKDRVKNILEITGQGKSFLAQFYSLTYVGDYASTYLALEYGLNPTPVKVIDYLKAELAKD
ncbi:MAG: bifunctional phosphoglucose/phosphomannose isomerase [Syntrophomonas sp.]